jgi:orotate phosphoribosyltransferase
MEYLQMNKNKMENFGTSQLIIHNLLKIKAIQFNFDTPYTWASGWKSPIYCDNRLSLSESAVRSFICDAYIEIAKAKFPDIQVVAGVSTGAIAQAALVADKLNLPLVYVREKPKGHGMMKTIEGRLEAGQKAVVIEDLVSTGGSSLKVVQEIRKVDAIVLGMIAIFSYEFPTAVENFEKNNCKLYTLAKFSDLINVALSEGYITDIEAKQIDAWHKNPQDYGR